MDPDDFYAQMRNQACTPKENRDAAEVLLIWLVAGGYTPLNWSDNRGELARECIRVIEASLPDFIGRYPAGVRVVCENRIG